ncbi:MULTISPECIES: hypothetical protein [unclassified Beijerinckia]|uniref:hypothetical protein n=1 Tax=unclassified Beijerinckia TaxID=2638183 RepID=UPI00089758A1|nr:MULTISPECIES: hypothetical protein [unclassified Beijerinckia]MDH7796812.1 hypothetical protein [Beijerinckia sp. GAS462]SEC60847.1 hypothetical protein SAMN05443249_3097 [Beijerinckia sp. 28-YEA-48]
MQPAEIGHTSRDLLEWGGPLIIDRINEHYFRLLRSRPDVARPLAQYHYRMWKFLLDGHPDEAASLRRELVNLARLAGCADSDLDDADRMVLVELMQVVMMRFNRSPNMACDYSLTLVDAASGLAHARLAVA